MTYTKFEYRWNFHLRMVSHFIIDLLSSFTFYFNCYNIMATSTQNKSTQTFLSTERPISSVFPSHHLTVSSMVITPVPFISGYCSFPSDLAEKRTRCFAGNLTLKKKLRYRRVALQQLIRACLPFWPDPTFPDLIWNILLDQSWNLLAQPEISLHLSTCNLIWHTRLCPVIWVCTTFHMI